MRLPPPAKRPHMRIVRIQHSDALRRQRLHQLIFRGRNACNPGREVLQVHRRNVTHHCPVRLCDLRQRRQLAAVVHAHLHHGHLVLRFQLQQLQRQAKAIVQITRTLQHVELRRQHRRDAFLGRRLACRPRHPNHPSMRAHRAPRTPHLARQLLHRRQHAVFALRHPQQLCGIHLRRHHPTRAHHRRRRAHLQRCLHVVVPVQPLACHRKKQVSRAHRA